MTTGHTAIVTGANHGIGAATATALARNGCAVLCTFLRVSDPVDPGIPQAYREYRAHGAERVVAGIREGGGRALAVEADLSDPAVPAMLFDAAEEHLGPVDILVNNATGWLADTFTPSGTSSLGQSLQPVTAATWTQQFAVDAMGAALMIGEFARRHVASQASWGRIIGLTSGGDLGFPETVSYGAAKAAQVNYTMSAAAELALFGVICGDFGAQLREFNGGRPRAPCSLSAGAGSRAASPAGSTCTTSSTGATADGPSWPT